MAKAYMSDPDSGPYFLRAPNVSVLRINADGTTDRGIVATPAVMSRDDAEAARMAVREAERILADTEPRTLATLHGYSSRQAGNLVRYGIGYPELRDALAAFVAEPGQ